MASSGRSFEPVASEAAGHFVSLLSASFPANRLVYGRLLRTSNLPSLRAALRKTQTNLISAVLAFVSLAEASQPRKSS